MAMCEIVGGEETWMQREVGTSTADRARAPPSGSRVLAWLMWTGACRGYGRALGRLDRGVRHLSAVAGPQNFLSGSRFYDLVAVWEQSVFYLDLVH